MSGGGGGDPSSISSLASNLALTSLQTVEEDSELNLGTSQEKVFYQHHPSAGGNSGNKQQQQQHTLTLSTLERTQRSRIRPSAGIAPEVFPSNKETAAGSTTHPYHAHSSIWNPVSRNDSEIQSQSSGAMGGDTTDDGNYSSFTDMSSSTFPEQAIKSIEEAKHRKLKERLREQQKIKRTAEQNRLAMDPINIQNFRPTNQGRGPPQPKNQEEFLNQVRVKLQIYLDEKKKRENLHHKLKQCDPGGGADVVVGSAPAGSSSSGLAGGAVAKSSHSLAASSSQLMMANRTASVSHLFNSSYNRSLRDDGESDQSILDEHCSRVFETTPVSLLLSKH